jgi:hypothetical protein
VKVLFDECVPRHLARHLAEHDVSTVQRMGWSSLSNGRLLAIAQHHFDVLLTLDSNLSYQQHLPQYHIAVLIISATSNRVPDLLPLVPAILAALPNCKPGLATRVPL